MPNTQRPQASSAPTVSVLMAVYNCAPYLSAALDSVLAQTFSNFEVVIVDDASTDDTPAILRSYAQRDLRLVLLRNAQNSKLSASLNTGLLVCRAPLVARADGDDLYPPTRLEKQVRFLERHPSVGVVSGYFDRVGDHERLLGRQELPINNDAIRFNLLWESSVCHAAAMYRHEIIQSVGGYDAAFSTAQDYDLWARLCDLTEFANLPESLMTVRIHAASSSAQRGKEQSRLALSVSRRMLTRYLGRALAEDEAAVLRSLLCAYASLGKDELHTALGLLDELLRHAKGRESTATLRWARRAIAASLVKQAYYRTYEDPAGSWKLLQKASEMSLHPAFCLPVAVQVLRLVLAKYRKRVVVPL